MKLSQKQINDLSKLSTLDLTGYNEPDSDKITSISNLLNILTALKEVNKAGIHLPLTKKDQQDLKMQFNTLFTHYATLDPQTFPIEGNKTYHKYRYEFSNRDCLAFEQKNRVFAITSKTSLIGLGDDLHAYDPYSTVIMFKKYDKKTKCVQICYRLYAFAFSEKGYTPERNIIMDILFWAKLDLVFQWFERERLEKENKNDDLINFLKQVRCKNKGNKYLDQYVNNPTENLFAEILPLLLNKPCAWVYDFTYLFDNLRGYRTNGFFTANAQRRVSPRNNPESNYYTDAGIELVFYNWQKEHLSKLQDHTIYTFNSNDDLYNILLIFQQKYNWNLKEFNRYLIKDLNQRIDFTNEHFDTVTLFGDLDSQTTWKNKYEERSAFLVTELDKKQAKCYQVIVLLRNLSQLINCKIDLVQCHADKIFRLIYEQQKQIDYQIDHPEKEISEDEKVVELKNRFSKAFLEFLHNYQIQLDGLGYYSLTIYDLNKYLLDLINRRPIDNRIFNMIASQKVYNNDLINLQQADSLGLNQKLQTPSFDEKQKVLNSLPKKVQQKVTNIFKVEDTTDLSKYPHVITNLVHGTKSDSVYSILLSGLLDAETLMKTNNQHYSYTASGLGNGIYFARSKQSTKSINYASSSKYKAPVYLFVCDVGYHKIKTVDQYTVPYLTSEQDLVFGDHVGGQGYDEIVAKNGKQVKMRYMIEFDKYRDQ